MEHLQLQRDCSLWIHARWIMIKAAGRSVCLSSLTGRESSAKPGAGRKRPGGRWLFMLAALTPLLIDLFREWSVNTAEQTYNGTINQRLEHRTTLCQDRMCVEPWGRLSVWMTGRCFVSTCSCTLSHTRFCTPYQTNSGTEALLHVCNRGELENNSVNRWEKTTRG